MIFALIMAAALELGKHTLLGWGLAAIAAIAFLWLRKKKLAGSQRIVRFGAWLGLFAVFALILFVSQPPTRAVPAVSGKNGGVTEVLHTAQGDLTGVLTEDGKVEVYTGIPYAKPPVGDLRWREPQPAEPWEGVFAADHFAPMSMQVTNSPYYDSLAQIIGYHDYKISLSDNWIPPVSEDSLYLNIWKPAGEAKDLPVLVYIHGGSLQTGQPWYQDYRGESLARDGVIVVNMGYRLGVFGFFADEALVAESQNGTTGNYGLLDQIAALEWVRDNISSFGGDPGNVTLAGESAGSACVSALCTSPLAKGLFRRAVMESSTVSAPQPAHSFRLLDKALADGKKTKERLGVSTIEELRALPAEKIVGEMAVQHHITVDGCVLEKTPAEAYAAGEYNEEAQLHGFNGEEAAPFILFSQANLKNYEQKIRSVFPAEYAERVLALYPAKTNAEARANWAEIDSVLLFSYGHYRLAAQAEANGIPSYVYWFTKDNGRLGDWHSGEEVYLYGNIPDDSRLYDESDRALSAQMKQYYLNFIRTGDPNGDGLETWDAASGALRVMEFGAGSPGTDAGKVCGMRDDPYAALHALLDERYVTAPSETPSAATPEETAEAAADPSGYYRLASIPAEGGAEAVRELEAFGLSVFLVIEPEGKGFLHMMGEEKEISWDGSAGTITINGDAAPFVLDPLTELLTIYDEREPYMIFWLCDGKAPERGEMKKAALGLQRTDEILQKRLTLIDHDDFRVTAAGCTAPETIFDDYAVNLTLVSKSEEKDLSFTIENVVVNGVNLGFFFDEALSPGEVRDVRLEIGLDDLKTFGIGDPTVIDVDLEVFRSGEYEAFFADYLTLYPLGEDKAETIKRTPGESDKLILNSEPLRLSFIGITGEPAVEYTALRFWAENASDLTAEILIGDVIYNEKDSGKGTGLKIAPHGAGPLTLYVRAEDLETLGGSITDVAFRVEVLDRELRTLLDEQVSFTP